jgi:hypothetical protein
MPCGCRFLLLRHLKDERDRGDGGDDNRDLVAEDGGCRGLRVGGYRCRRVPPGAGACREMRCPGPGSGQAGVMVGATRAADRPPGVPQECGGRYGRVRAGRCQDGGGRVAGDAGALVTELAAGDHACLTFGESEELFDLTAAFVRDGLAAGFPAVHSDLGPCTARILDFLVEVRFRQRA